MFGTCMDDQLALFDKLYDTKTGGWRTPGMLTGPITESIVSQYIAQPFISYGNVEREVAHMYRSMVHMLGIERALETGTHNGYSAAHIAAAMEERQRGFLVTIDIDAHYHLFQGCDFAHRVRFVQGNSATVHLDDCEYDALFLDSDHHARTILAELNRFAPSVKIGGTIFMHDVLFFDGVGLVAKALMQRPEFEVVILPTPRTHETGTRPPGMAIARKIAPVAPGFLHIDPLLADVEVSLPGRTVQDVPFLDVRP